MCVHREHRTGNCRICTPSRNSVALSNGNTVTTDAYLSGDYGNGTVAMPQLWEGDQA